MPSAIPISIDSPPPLPPETLVFRSMVATEALGRCFDYAIEVTSARSDLTNADLLGLPITVQLQTVDGDLRCFNGLIDGLHYLGTNPTLDPTVIAASKYRLVVRPWLWFLSRNANSRIFQNMTIPDILKKVFTDQNFTDFDFSNLTLDDYPPKEYVVQYRESDFNFVTRLMEREGIYYFFEHAVGVHTLVLVDSYVVHNPPDSSAGEGVPYALPFLPASDTLSENIDDWNLENTAEAGMYTHADFDFTKPRARLSASRSVSQGYGHDDLEVYDYPGGFVDSGAGEATALVRIQERQQPLGQATGWSNGRKLTVGCLFTMTGHPRDDQNGDYLVTAATSRLRGHDARSGLGGDDHTFSCTFTAIDAKRQFRPHASAKKPVVRGPQTAIVVGPAGAEIFADKYGRVKVQFHWDREGASDEKSSCYVRVTQAWAGANFGAIFTPRIGQEVIVDFLEGDPDRPIITGCVYNAVNMPPYELPAHLTKSGVKTRSSKGGNGTNANELRFEDAKGSEELWVQAEKDLNALVKNDETRNVGVNRTVSIGSNEALTVGQNRTVKVKVDESITVSGNETLNVGGNRSATVSGNDTTSITGNESTSVVGNQSLQVVGSRSAQILSTETILVVAAQSVTAGSQAVTVGSRVTTVATGDTLAVGGDRSETIGGDRTETVGGDRSETIGGDHAESVTGNRTVDINGDQTVSIVGAGTLKIGKDFSIDVAENLVIKVGDASITLKKSGDVLVKGGKVTVQASSDLVLKGSKVSIN